MCQKQGIGRASKALGILRFLSSLGIIDLQTIFQIFLKIMIKILFNNSENNLNTFFHSFKRSNVVSSFLFVVEEIRVHSLNFVIKMSLSLFHMQSNISRSHGQQLVASSLISPSRGNIIEPWKLNCNYFGEVPFCVAYLAWHFGFQLGNDFTI